MARGDWWEDDPWCGVCGKPGGCGGPDCPYYGLEEPDLRRRVLQRIGVLPEKNSVEADDGEGREGA